MAKAKSATTKERKGNQIFQVILKTKDEAGKITDTKRTVQATTSKKAITKAMAGYDEVHGVVISQHFASLDDLLSAIK